MHRFDEVPATTLVDILAVALDRLALDPVPLDGSATPEDLAIAAPSFISEDGTLASEVLRVYRDVLAPAVISIDSPRYFSFIPTAPTKLSLLFDLVVSAASLMASRGSTRPGLCGRKTRCFVSCAINCGGLRVPVGVSCREVHLQTSPPWRWRGTNMVGLASGSSSSATSPIPR